MKYFLSLCFIFAALWSATAADRVTATVTLTNTAVDADTFIVNGIMRTWKDSVSTPATEVATGADEFETTTNLVNHLLATPFSRVTVYQLDDDSFRLDGDTGVDVIVTGAGNYFSVSYSTQTVATATPVLVPYTSIPSSRRQAIGEGLVDWLNLSSISTQLDPTQPAFNDLVGLPNTQTITGAKTFSSASGVWNGTVVASPGISGNLGNTTNGILWTPIFSAPAMTNGINYGAAFRSPGTGNNSTQIGEDAEASGEGGVAIGNLAGASVDGTTAIGNEAQASGLDAVAIGSQTFATHWDATAIGSGSSATAAGATAIGALATAAYTNSIAIGNGTQTTSSNQIRIGSANEYFSIPSHISFENGARQTNATFASTNNFPANSDLAFARLALTSLANGNNAAVPVGTNVFIEVSGPSAAFTINGLNAAPNRDGKLIIVVNQTGQDMTIAHQSGTDPTAANRIISMTGADRSTTGNGSATLIYSGAASRWLLLALDP